MNINTNRTHYYLSEVCELLDCSYFDIYDWVQTRGLFKVYLHLSNFHHRSSTLDELIFGVIDNDNYWFKGNYWTQKKMPQILDASEPEYIEFNLLEVTSEGIRGYISFSNCTTDKGLTCRIFDLTDFRDDIKALNLRDKTELAELLFGERGLQINDDGETFEIPTINDHFLVQDNMVIKTVDLLTLNQTPGVIVTSHADNNGNQTKPLQVLADEISRSLIRSGHPPQDKEAIYEIMKHYPEARNKNDGSIRDYNGLKTEFNLPSFVKRSGQGNNNF